MNTLTIPAPAMAYPFHMPGVPTVYTLAALGWNVLHAVFHIFGIDSRTSHFKPYRTIKEWQDSSIAAFSVSSSVLFRDSDPFRFGFSVFLTSRS